MIPILDEAPFDSCEPALKRPGVIVNRPDKKKSKPWLQPRKQSLHHQQELSPSPKDPVEAIEEIEETIEETKEARKRIA